VTKYERLLNPAKRIATDAEACKAFDIAWLCREGCPPPIPGKELPSLDRTYCWLLSQEKRRLKKKCIKKLTGKKR
jgi:hypothetical protein